MSDEARLTFVVTCKGRLHHLRRSLPRLAGQRGCRVIVVDSSCPDGAGHWVSSSYPQAQVVFLQDDGTFNPSRSRNAGLKMCQTEWICFVDADVIIASDFYATVCNIIEDRCFYTFKIKPGMRGSGGTCIVKRSDAVSVGGYDELIDAWSGKDWDFYYRLGLAGSRRIKLTLDLIDDVIQHSDDSRTRFHLDKDIRINCAVAMLYVAAKLNIMKHIPKFDEDVKSRKILFDEIASTVTKAAKQRDRRAFVEISVPSIMRAPPLGIQIGTKLKLNIDLSKTLDESYRHVVDPQQAADD
jgi:glycosyltransferase involved in cell wall biosynthesis